MENQQHVPAPHWSGVRECLSHWRAYLYTTVACCLFSIIYTWVIPEEYVAKSRIADEFYKVELSYHLDNSLWRRLRTFKYDQALEDIYIYPQLLDSESFLSQLASVQVPGHDQTWDEYVLEHYTFNEPSTPATRIRSRIDYEVLRLYQMATIIVRDRDPLVAAQLNDSILSCMRRYQDTYRDAKARQVTQQDYDFMVAQEAEVERCATRYAEYADSHYNASSEEVKQRLASMEEDLAHAQYTYRTAALEYQRDYNWEHQNSVCFQVVERPTVSHDPVSPLPGVVMLVTMLTGWLLCTWGILLRRKCREGHLSARGLFSPFSPWGITLLVWGVILSLLHLYEGDLYPCKDQVYVAVGIWTAAFVTCSLLTYLALPSHEDYPWQHLRAIDLNEKLFQFLWVMALIITPLFMWQVLQIVLHFSTKDILYNIRVLAVHGDTHFGILSYSQVINQVLFIIAIWRYPRIPGWKLATIYATNLISSFALMERGGLFFLLIGTIFVLYEKRIIKVRSIIITFAVMFLIFFGINLIRFSSETSENQDFTLIDFFALYVLSPPVAFGYVCEDLSGQFGSHTLGQVYLLLNKFLHTTFIVNRKLQDFVYVPMPTNVYTIMQPFFQDFGYAGVAFFGSLYGVVSAWLYRHYRNGSSIARCIYAYFVYALVLQFYQENILLSLIFFTQFCFFIVLSLQKWVGVTLGQRHNTSNG